MNRSGSHISGQGHISRDMEPPRATPSKQRKSSRFGSVIRKLLGRKNIKSQISLPTPTRQMEDGPTDFITSAADPRVQRAVSMPAQHHGVSRNSALGSHKPFSHISEEKSPKVEQFENARPPRPRRASMPGGYSVTPEPMADHTVQEEDVYQQHLDEANIGYAVTSGSHPRRRSRSAGALHDTLKEHRMSPIQWRHLKRRSDEIKYWRNSIGVMDMAVPDTEPGQTIDSGIEAPGTVSAGSVYKDAESDDGNITDDSDKENRQTFDFGILAGNMNEQEQIPIAERVMTVEVKLMDLEYAISKIQARSPSPLPKTSPSNPPSSHLQTPASEHIDRVNSKSEQGSNSTTSNQTTYTTSTAATAPSLHTIPDHVPDPFTCQSVIDTPSARPTSAATTLRLNPPSPLQEKQTPSYNNSNGNAKHNSITSITIDHYATLINLIRREQAARIRLEDQVAELQRELFLFKAQTQAGLTDAELGIERKPSQASFTRSQSSFSQSRASFYQRRRNEVRKMESFDDNTSTEGYEDVYETPTETRREWENLATPRGTVEGAAF